MSPTIHKPGAKLPQRPLRGLRALGLKATRPNQIVQQVKAGFSFDQVVNLENQSGLSRDRIAAFAAIPRRTLDRRQQQGRLSAEESDRVLRASRVFEMAVDLFEGDVTAARTWLEQPNVGLGGAVPLEYASTDVGAREVENLIGRLEHGIGT